MVRDHQRPRRERHELPGDEERERVGGEHDEVHAGQKQRIERQHALRRLLVAAIAERKQACSGGAEIDHRQERTPTAHRCGNAHRAKASRAAALTADSGSLAPSRYVQRGSERQAAKRRGLPRRRSDSSPRPSARFRRASTAIASSTATQDSARVSVMTAGPQPDAAAAAGAGGAFSEISSMPAASSAATSFINELTLPRIVPVAGFHALNGGQRQSGRFGQLALVDAEQGAGRAYLACRDHANRIRSDV